MKKILYLIFKFQLFLLEVRKKKKLADKKWSQGVKRGIFFIQKSDKKISEALSDDEKKWIRITGKCPDCMLEDLYEGPSGGISTNFSCGNKNCNSKFNIALGMDLGPGPPGGKGGYSSKGKLHILTAHRI